MVYFSLAREDIPFGIGDNITIASKLSVNDDEGMRVNYIDLEVVEDGDIANTNMVRVHLSVISWYIVVCN